MAVTRQKFKNLADKFVTETFADFTHDYSFEELTKTDDGQGGYSTEWVLFTTVTGFAKVNSSNEGELDDHIKSDYDYKFSFRFVEGINTKLRLVHKNEVYNIKRVESVQDVDIWIDVYADKEVAT